MTRDLIRGSSDRSILILTSLAGSPKHGYALIKDVEDFAGIKLGAGTLYGALSMLEKEGLVEALPAEERRRPYQITAAGREQLRVRLSEAARIAEVGLRRITLAVLPSVQVAEVGIAVVIGVLIDTLLVRTVLVPAGFLLIGERVWWPSRNPHPPPPPPPRPLHRKRRKAANAVRDARPAT